jgi:hypothetical protein
LTLAQPGGMGGDIHQIEFSSKRSLRNPIAQCVATGGRSDCKTLISAIFQALSCIASTRMFHAFSAAMAAKSAR